jgi:hypothetical protein
MRTPVVLVLTVAMGLSTVPSAPAGLYDPDEPPAFTIAPDGAAQPLSLNRFQDLYTDALNVGDDRPERKPNKIRDKYLERVAQRGKKGFENLSPAERVAQSADLIRLRQYDRALEMLTAASRDPLVSRSPAYYPVLCHLSLVHAVKGEFRDALRYLIEARSSFPTDPVVLNPEMSKEQLAWCRKVDREYLVKLLNLRAKEQASRPPGQPGHVETVDALFDVRFVGDSGEFEPGKLAASEREKLPKDAVAVVQQLLLWLPGDERLSWLLAELYNANGDLKSAETLYDQRVNNGFQTAALKEHRRLVKDAIPVIPPPPERWLPDAGKLWLVGGTAGLIVLALAYFQVRAVRGRGRGPR